MPVRSCSTRGAMRRVCNALGDSGQMYWSRLRRLGAFDFHLLPCGYVRSETRVGPFEVRNQFPIPAAVVEYLSSLGSASGGSPADSDGRPKCQRLILFNRDL